MDPGAIHNHDHTPFSTNRTGQAFFDQATKGFRISFLGTDAHDCTRTPIRCGALMTLGWVYTRGTDFPLLSP
jgi:hypothetical protein